MLSAKQHVFAAKAGSPSLLVNQGPGNLADVHKNPVSSMLAGDSGLWGAGMTVDEVSTSESMRRMIAGFQVSQALYVAAKLGIADLLAKGPRG